LTIKSTKIWTSHAACIYALASGTSSMDESSSSIWMDLEEWFDSLQKLLFQCIYNEAWQHIVFLLRFNFAKVGAKYIDFCYVNMDSNLFVDNINFLSLAHSICSLHSKSLKWLLSSLLPDSFFIAIFHITNFQSPMCQDFVIYIVLHVVWVACWIPLFRLMALISFVSYQNKTSVNDKKSSLSTQIVCSRGNFPSSFIELCWKGMSVSIRRIKHNGNFHTSCHNSVMIKCSIYVWWFWSILSFDP